MKRNTQKVVIEAEVPRSLTEVGVDAVDAAIKAAGPYLEQVREAGMATAQAKLGPLAGQTKDRIAPLAEQAKDRIAPLAEQAKDRIAPLAEQAKDRIVPLAGQARDRAEQAQEFLAPYVTDAQAKLGPMAHEAKIRGAAGARGTLDNLAPRLEQALLAVGPLAEEAASRLHDDVVPRAAHFLDKAAEVAEVQSKKGGRKARKAAARLDKAHARLARRQKGGAGRVWTVLLILSGLVGVAVLVAKKLATPKQDAWQNYQPSQPAATPPATPAGSPAAPDAGPAPSAARAEESDEDELDDETLEREAEMIGEGGGVTDRDTTVSTDTATSYGPDSYVGVEPPEAFTIKGNPRSMKYHVPGSDSYERTITDVWFSTEEAAKAAGFTKATR